MSGKFDFYLSIAHDKGLCALVKRCKDAIKYHFRLRFPEKDAVPNHGLIMEVIASAVIGAYTYWMEHPDEVDTQKLADISVQMLSSVEQII